MNKSTADGQKPKPDGTLPARGGVTVAIWVVVGMIVCAIAWVALTRPGKPLPTGLVENPLGVLPDRPAVERSGAEITTHDLLDRYLVVDFFFISCSGPCPILTQKMGELQEAIREADDVRLVSFTTDPRRDRPEVLAAYATENGADPDLWWFLFTNKGNVAQIAVDGMRVGGDPGEPMFHSNRFSLVDRSGTVRGYYSPIRDPAWKETLLADLDRLRAEDDARGPE